MNTNQDVNRKLMLVYPRALTEVEQVKIVRLTSATSSEYIFNGTSAESELIELLHECRYKDIPYRSSAMVIETKTALSMIIIDQNIVPALIIDIGTDVLSKYDTYLNLMTGISNIDSYLEGAKTVCETYEWDHEQVFGEVSDIADEMNWGEIEGVINDERDRIIEKIRSVLDRYIVKS